MNNKFCYALLLVLLIVSTKNYAFTFKEAKKKMLSPLEDPLASKVLLSGAILTSALVLNKKGIIDPIQADASHDKPLGHHLATFGDLMGKSIPNAIYIGGMYLDYLEHGNHKSLSKASYMFDATVYAGLTTIVLKRIFGERRPDKGDHLSFPSGHMTTATAFATVIALEHEWYWGLLAGTTAGIVGYSRINDNAHYLHDVVFGATLGVSFALGLRKFHHSSNESKSYVFAPFYINNENCGLMFYTYF